jgi:hypothetical protein
MRELFSFFILFLSILSLRTIADNRYEGDITVNDHELSEQIITPNSLSSSVYRRDIPIVIRGDDGTQTSYRFSFFLDDIDNPAKIVATFCSDFEINVDSCRFLLIEMTAIIDENQTFIRSINNKHKKNDSNISLLQWFDKDGNNTKQQCESLLAFYTIFCGTTNDIIKRGDVIPSLPSLDFPCYFFSDNLNTLVRAREKGWIAELLDGLPSHDVNISGMKSKDLKARPHTNSKLRKYRYTVYHDTKLTVTESLILTILEDLPPNKSIAMCKHRIFSGSVSIWQEYNESLNQDRYRIEKDMMEMYINDNLNNGLSSIKTDHLSTGFIFRKMSKITQEIGEVWYQNIVKCGIECQVSMFFVHQQYADDIFAFPRSWFPGKDVVDANAMVPIP